jgi:hypothetical protein
VSEGARRPTVRVVLIAGALIALVVVGVLVARAVSDPDRELLGRSGPQETVLRSLRLAGVEHAVVDFDDGVAVLRVDIPVLTSASDATLVSHSAFATLAAVYPGAERYVVQLFATGQPLIELSGAGDEIRDAVDSDDPAGLDSARAARLITRPGEPAAFPAELLSDDRTTAVTAGQAERATALLTATPEGATSLTAGTLAIDVHLAGAYLDAKNRAVGLLGDDGPAGVVAELADAADAVRGEAPGVRAPGPDERAFDVYRDRLRTALAGAAIEGSAELLAGLEALGPDPGRAVVAEVRRVVLAVESVTTPAPASAPSVIAGAHGVAEQVAASMVPSGPAADAVLAAADADSAPESAVNVSSFSRETTLDVVPGSPRGDQDALPVRVLRLNARGAGRGTAPSLGWSTPEGGDSIAPEVWVAYRRADGTLFWLAEQDGDVALTDASLRGWAFSRGVAAVVDASRCGRMLATFPAE